ncbi:MAG: hypothetical protein OJJ21_22215 [Ferrovibrio sp.]|uniref:hypothetical protein n=1 Tax=Ferrovibrio sp. TaxID=1917215 RepID=UPI00262DC77E|nr:hypothetical protein [Ferrovibrio sp.]MCW0236329.1 hypothetical protein [Ferrovibrio sp.]
MTLHNRNFLAETVAKHRRTAVLCVLYDLSSRFANLPIIQDIVQEKGFGCAHEELRQDFIFLKEQGLVELDEMDGLWIIRLIIEGVEVIEGRRACEGILRRPESDVYRLKGRQ